MVHADHALAKQTGDEGAQDGPREGHDGNELDVVQPDREVAVAQSFERSDLLALSPDHARHDHVEQERRYAEKNRRHHRAHRLELFEFFTDEAIRRLLVAAERAPATVRLDDAIDRIEHRSLVSTGFHRHDDIIEGAFHVERCAQRLAGQPQHAEALVVGPRVARGDRVDVLG